MMDWYTWHLGWMGVLLMSDHLWCDCIDCVCTCQMRLARMNLKKSILELSRIAASYFSQVLNHELTKKNFFKPEREKKNPCKVCKVPISSWHYLVWRRISCQLKRQTCAQKMICGGQIIAWVHLETHAPSTAVLLILCRIVSISIYFSYNYKNTSRDPCSAPSSFNITMSYVYASLLRLDRRFRRRNVWKQRWQSLYFYIFTEVGGCTLVSTVHAYTLIHSPVVMERVT